MINIGIYEWVTKELDSGVKGGPKSGNWGHGGGIGGSGNPGGSTGKGAGVGDIVQVTYQGKTYEGRVTRVAPNSKVFVEGGPVGKGFWPKEIELVKRHVPDLKFADIDDVSGSVLSEVREWGVPDSARVGGTLIALGNPGDKILLRDGDELVGVAYISHQRGMTLVGWLATKRGGYGRQFMNEVVARAAELGNGVTLDSVEGAKGFYETIGMRAGTGNDYYYTQDDVKRLVGSKELVDDDEPEDGVFTVPMHEDQLDEAVE